MGISQNEFESIVKSASQSSSSGGVQREQYVPKQVVTPKIKVEPVKKKSKKKKTSSEYKGVTSPYNQSLDVSAGSPTLMALNIAEKTGANKASEKWVKENINKPSKNKLDNAIRGTVGSFLDNATFGVYNRGLEKKYGKAATRYQTGPAKYVGMGLSMVTPGGIEALVGKGLMKVAPKLAKEGSFALAKKLGKKAVAKEIGRRVAAEATKGAVTGAAYGVGNVAAAKLQGEKVSAKDALKNIGLSALVGAGAGGVLGSAVSGVKAFRTKPSPFGRGIGDSVVKLSKKAPEPEVKLEQPTTSVRKPTPREAMQSLSYATGKGKLQEPMLALPPGPKLQGIKAIRDIVVPNKYVAKWNTFVQEAQRLGITDKPGRNMENWNSLWSRIADREDPGLMELVNLAFTPSTRNLVSLKNQGFTRRANDLAGNVRRGFERARTIRQNPGMFGGFANPFIRTAEKPQRPIYNPIDAVETTVRNKQALKNKLGLTQSPVVKSEKVTVPTTKEPVMNISAEKQPGLVRVKPLKKEQITQSSLRKMKLKNSGKTTDKKRPYEATFEELTSHTEKQIVPLSKKIRTTHIGLFGKLYTRIRDSKAPLKLLDKQLKKSGKKVDISNSVYEVAQLQSRARVTAAQFLEHMITDATGRNKGVALKKILKGLNNEETRAFWNYMLHRRNTDRAAKGEQIFRELDGVKITAEDSQRVVKEFEKRFPSFEKRAKLMYKYDDSILDVGLENGTLDPKMVERIKLEEPNYVENMRANRGLPNLSQIKRKGLGSGEDIYNPMEVKVKKTINMFDFFARNETNLVFLKNIEKNPEAFKGIAEILPSSSEIKSEMADSINKIIAQAGGYDDLSKAIDEGMAKLEKEKYKENVITVLDKGKPVRILIHDSEIYRSLQRVLPKERGFVLKALQTGGMIFKKITTGNPVWGLTRGIFMDAPTAFSRGSINNPIKFATEVAKATFDVIKGENSAAYTLFKNLGAGMQGLTGSDIDVTKHVMRDIVGGKTLPQKLMRGIDKMNEATSRLEDIFRLVEFKKTIGANTEKEFKNLLEAGIVDKNLAYQAVKNANEVTINFGRSGEWTREIEQFIVYTNVAVNGLATYAESFGKKNFIPKVIGAISVPTVIAYLINCNDKDYQNLNQDIRDNNFLIPIGDGRFFKIPVPREYAVIFKSPIERALQIAFDKDPEAFKTYGKAVVNSLLPPGPSQIVESASGGKEYFPSASILQPIIDIAANQNYYGGKIVPQNLVNASPRYQATGKETKLSTFIGDKLNVSPAKLDYLIKSYGGTYAKLSMPIGKKSEGPKEALLGLVATQKPGFTEDISKFYDLKKKYEEQATNARNGKPVKPFYNPIKMRILNRFSSNMSNLYKQIRETEKNNSLSNKEKKKNIQEKQKEISILAKQALEYFKNK